MKGFTAFRERQEIDFSGLEVFAIAGPTGSGKSSILDAMTYALYGEIDRVGIQCGQLVSQGLSRMAVTLDFRVGRDSFRITRSTPTQGPARVALERLIDGEAQSYGEGADRVREVREIVRGIVGMDYDGFTRSVILPQGKFAEFLTGDPKKRREILTDLLGLGLFDRMGKRANAVARDAKYQADAKRVLVDREYADVSEESLASAQARADTAAKRQALLGEAFHSHRHFDRAVALLSLAIRGLPQKHDQLQFAIGRAYFGDEKYPQAQQAFIAGANSTREGLLVAVGVLR